MLSQKLCPEGSIYLHLRNIKVKRWQREIYKCFYLSKWNRCGYRDFICGGFEQRTKINSSFKVVSWRNLHILLRNTFVTGKYMVLSWCGIFVHVRMQTNFPGVWSAVRPIIGLPPRGPRGQPAAKLSIWHCIDPTFVLLLLGNWPLYWSPLSSSQM